MGRLGLALLGPLLVTQDNRTVTDFEYDKVRALLVYLALEADRPQRRETLAGLLWPEQPEKVARDSLRNALATLRKAINDEAADPPHLFITREAVQFNIAGDHILDAAEFVGRLELCIHHRHRNPANCRTCASWRREAADLYRGPLLAQFSLADSPEFESWVVIRREELHRQAMANFAWLADFHLLRGDDATAQFFAGRQLAYEPWREAAHRQAMLALINMGERSAALAHYHAACRTLADELGVAPESETTLLFERIRDGVAGQRNTRRTVPALPLPLIGREADLRAIGQRLIDPDVRLLTLLGPGGVGKTSLALAAGDWFGADFANGVAFVSLATAKVPEDIASHIAAALGLDLQASTAPADQVADYLRRRELLLILDNFEHVVAGAKLVAGLLTAAPRVVVLVTTRQRLNLAVEWVYELQGLSFPAEDSAVPLSEFGAIQLFVRRARQERGDFALLSAEAVAAADICRLVQGMPLAIELAAAATSVQSTVEVAHQLRTGLDALAVEWADLPPRHRSIRTVFDYTWTSLSDGERRVLRRLSLFSGGFDMPAAGAIAGASAIDLRRLRDKSLIQVREEGRFDMHPLLLAFAAEQLTAQDEAGQAAREYLLYFTSLAEQGEQALKGRDQLLWLRRLEAEHANILVALDWAEDYDPIGAARLAGAMWLFWFMRGHLVESRRRYERLYPGRARLPARDRARLVNGYASTSMGQGDFRVLEPLAAEALAGFSALDDPEGIVLSQHHLTIAARARGDLHSAVTHALAGIDATGRHSLSGLSWVLAVVKDTLSSVYIISGQLDEAEALAREVEALALAAGDRWGWAYHVFRRTSIELGKGNWEAARDDLLKVLAVAEEYHDRRLIVFASNDLGQIALRGEDLAEAWRRAETAERYSLEVGDQFYRGEVLELLGDVLRCRSFSGDAAARYREAINAYTAAGDEQRAGQVAIKLAAASAA